MKNKINEIKKILNVKELDYKKKFTELSFWDSIYFINFIISLEKKFNIKLLPKDIIKIKSIDTTIKVIKKYENKKK